MSPDEDSPGVVTFALSAPNVGNVYPPPEVSREIGRITVAAARLDRHLALTLTTLRQSEPPDELLTWSSGKLCQGLAKRLRVLLDEPLLTRGLEVVDDAREALDERHAVNHSIWLLNTPELLVSIREIERAHSLGELDNVMRREVASDSWETLHPRGRGPGPQQLDELRAILTHLEASTERVRDLQFTLASALYVGQPVGAKEQWHVRPDWLKLHQGCRSPSPGYAICTALSVDGSEIGPGLSHRLHRT